MLNQTSQGWGINNNAPFKNGWKLPERSTIDQPHKHIPLQNSGKGQDGTGQVDTLRSKDTEILLTESILV
ncbi:MAG: hypothetical protein EA366_02335, partial [Spirulina sp. DLM2.Bin59]